MIHKCIDAFARSHMDTGACIHTQGVQRLDTCFKYCLASLTSKDNYLEDLKKLKSKVGSAQLQRLFLKKLTNVTEACHRKPVISEWKPTAAQTEAVTALPWTCSEGEACEGHRLELCPLRHQGESWRRQHQVSASIHASLNCSVGEEEKHMDD